MCNRHLVIDKTTYVDGGGYVYGLGLHIDLKLYRRCFDAASGLEQPSRLSHQ